MEQSKKTKLLRTIAKMMYRWTIAALTVWISASTEFSKMAAIKGQKSLTLTKSKIREWHHLVTQKRETTPETAHSPSDIWKMPSLCIIKLVYSVPGDISKTTSDIGRRNTLADPSLTTLTSTFLTLPSFPGIVSSTIPMGQSFLLA